MFGVLLESNARRRRRSGGAALSVGMHAAVLTLAVALTAEGASRTEAPASVKPVKVIWAPAPTPRPARAPVHQLERGGAPTSCDCPPIPLPQFPTTAVPIPQPIVDHPVPDEGWLRWPGDSSFTSTHTLAGGILDGGRSSEPWEGRELATSMLNAARPRYPDALREAGIAGHVLVEFAVDTTGRVDMTSVRIIESTHELFTRAVRDALPSMRLVPAEVRGRKVRMLARMPFQFTLDGRSAGLRFCSRRTSFQFADLSSLEYTALRS